MKPRITVSLIDPRTRRLVPLRPPPSRFALGGLIAACLAWAVIVAAVAIVARALGGAP